MPELKWEKGLLCFVHHYHGMLSRMLHNDLKLKELIPLTAFKFKIKLIEAGSQKCKCFK